MVLVTPHTLALPSSSPSLQRLALSIFTLLAIGCVEPTTFTPLAPTPPALRLPMNNAYLGSIHSSDLRPKFVWEPSVASSSGDIRYEIQLSTDRTFEGDKIEATIFEPEFQPDQALPVSLVAPVGARYFWQVRACVRDSCSKYTRPRYANVGRVQKDYNGDGYSDLVISAPASNMIYPRGGLAYLYYGGPGESLDEIPDATIGTMIETRPDLFFGIASSPAGDVNGDGFADLLIGIRASLNGLSQRAYLYLGTPASFDIVVDTAFLPTPSLPGYAKKMAGAGDLNGDGYDDVVVQAFVDEQTTSYAKVYFGAPKGAVDTRPDGNLSWPGRYSVATTAGDVNGDGFADLIIGSGEDMEGGSYYGAAYIFEGGAGDSFDEAFDSKLLGYENREHFGENVASAGDLNGDGFSDVMVGIRKTGESGDGRPGRAYVFFGGAGPFDRMVDLTLQGTSTNDQFGQWMAPAGDVDGDEYDDLVIGGADSYLYFGGPGRSMDIFADATLPGHPTLVFPGGDLNGDGLDDVGVSIASYQVTGRVNLYLGKPDWLLATTPNTTLQGATALEGFGASVASLPFSTAKKSPGHRLRVGFKEAVRVGDERMRRDDALPGVPRGAATQRWAWGRAGPLMPALTEAQARSPRPVLARHHQ